MPNQTQIQASLLYTFFLPISNLILTPTFQIETHFPPSSTFSSLLLIAICSTNPTSPKLQTKSKILITNRLEVRLERHQIRERSCGI